MMDEVTMDNDPSVEKKDDDIMDESSDGAQPPALSSYVAGCKFWCTFAVAPVAFCLINGIVLSTVMDWGHVSREPNQAATVTSFRNSCAYLAVLLLLDTFALYAAAGFVETQVDALDKEAPDESSDDGSYNEQHVHAQVSRKLDKFLGNKSPPRVSILVSLLYLATCLAGALSMSVFALWIYANTEHAATFCTMEESSSKSRDGEPNNSIQDLPEELQQWAKSWDDGFSYPNHGHGGDFVHMTDGSTFFLGKGTDRPRQDHNNDNPSAPEDDQQEEEEEEEQQQQQQQQQAQRWSPRRLISTGSDGTLHVHSDVFSPRLLKTVQGDSELQSEAFCCLYSVEDDEQNIAKALCVTASGDGLESSGGDFRNVTVREDDIGRYTDAELAMAYEREYWVLFVHSCFDDNRREPCLQKRMEINRINPSTMEMISVVNVTGDAVDYMMHDGLHGGWVSAIAVGTCGYWVGVIGCSVASACFLLGSFWLYRIRHLQAGVAPACFAIWGILSLVNVRLANTAELLVAMAITVSLLGGLRLLTTWLGREALLWMLYATLASYSASLIYDLIYVSLRLYSWMCVSSFGIFLGHPVLQLWGWVFGISSIVFGYYYMRSVGMGVVLVVAFIGIIVGSGFVAAGNKLSKYHAFLCFHTKRLCTKAVGGTKGARKSRSN